MADRAEVLIIGGGVIGVCIAYYLSRKERQVVLLEKQDLCAGSSYGNLGMLVPSHSMPLAGPGIWRQTLTWLFDRESPLYIKPRLDSDLIRWLFLFCAACRERCATRAIPTLAELGRRSLQLYQELIAREELEVDYKQQGWLLVFKTEEGFLEGLREARAVMPFGVRHEILDRSAVLTMEPAVRPELVAGIHYPDDAHLTPHRLVSQLGRIAKKNGVIIHPSTEVIGFSVSRSRISQVQTTRGSYQPQEVILAAGAWTPLLARQLGLQLPIQAAKGYSITVRRKARQPQMPVYLFEKKVAATPMGPWLRLGGTLELAGIDFSFNQRRIEAILQSGREYLNGLQHNELVEIWRGLRPATPDSLPLLGRPHRPTNLIVASGHGMLGVSLGAITGRLVSELVCGETPSMDLRPLHATRFSEQPGTSSI